MRVRSRPFLGSRWSHGKQITFRWASVRVSYKTLTSDSGAAGRVAGATIGSAQAGTTGRPTARAAAAALAPARNVRREGWGVGSDMGSSGAEGRGRARLGRDEIVPSAVGVWKRATDRHHLATPRRVVPRRAAVGPCR